MTGTCMPKAPPSAADGGTAAATKPSCPAVLSLRQGNSAFLDAPGARIEDLTVENIPGDPLTATIGLDPSGSGKVGITINAPHGAPTGDTFGNATRIITITTSNGGIQFVRRVPVIVTFITAALGGDDSAGSPGTYDHPFATLFEAAKWALNGDTILVRNPLSPDNDGTNGPGADMRTVVIHSGVAVRCLDDDPAQLQMSLTIEGDAILQGLMLRGPRLKITVPRSTVTLAGDILSHGLTVDTIAGVAPGSIDGTVVNINDGTQVFDSRSPTDPAQPPLLIQANGASVNVDGSGIKMVDDTAPVDAIRVEGSDETLTINNTDVVNAGASPALHITGPTTATITGATFNADVLVEDSSTSVTASNTTFQGIAVTFRGQDLSIIENSTLWRSRLTFQGRNLALIDTTIDTTIDGDEMTTSQQGYAPTPGQDIVQVLKGSTTAKFENVTFRDAPVTFAGQDLVLQGVTTFSDSLLSFQGTTLTATDSVFIGQGIVQDGDSSTATLNNVTITNYKQFGYKVRNGMVNITNGTFAHDLSVPVSADGGVPPWALSVPADADTASGVRSKGTKYDGVPFMPPSCDFQSQGYCGVMGPKDCASVYSISQMRTVEFAP